MYAYTTTRAFFGMRVKFAYIKLVTNKIMSQMTMSFVKS